MQKDIILFGIQGSGKGTMADLLLEKKLDNHKYFEPGQVFRAIKSNDNVIGEHIRDAVNKGEMVNDYITYRLFDIYFHLVQEGKFMLIDGFLRSLNQMYYFLHKMHIEGPRDFIAVFYDLPRDIAIQRLLKRAEIEGRKDDNMESINKRLDISERETLPVVNYLKSIGKVIIVNADQSIDGNFQETCDKLEI